MAENVKNKKGVVEIMRFKEIYLLENSKELEQKVKAKFDELLKTFKNNARKIKIYIQTEIEESPFISYSDRFISLIKKYFKKHFGEAIV